MGARASVLAHAGDHAPERGRWQSFVLLGVSALLVFAAWPRLQASLLFLPVDSAIARYFETREFPAGQLEALASRAVEVVERQPHHRYWDGLALLRYLQALDPATPGWERAPSLRRSLTASTESLRRSPVNPYAWLQVAQARHALGRSPQEVVSALEMSVLTGRVEPQLILPRLELGIGYLAGMNESQRAQLSGQASLALRLRRSHLLAALRAGRLDLASLRRLAPPGMESELNSLEQQFDPAG